MLISNKNSNRSENFTKTVKEKKRNDSKKQRMFTDIDNCPGLIKFFTFSTNESVFRPRHGDTRKKIISANDRDKLNPDPRM